MKKIFIGILFLIVASHSFAQDDTSQYHKYPNGYGLQVPKLWAPIVLRMPDSTRAMHSSGNIAHSGNKVYISDGSAWHLIGGGGVSAVDTVYSVITNTDTIFSIQIHTDTINTIITNSDTIYSITIRTDSIFSTVSHLDTIYNNILTTDSVYSITSHTDTLIVNNNLVIPIRDTGDYANPVIGSITFAPSDNNYYGYAGDRWLCFSCAGNGTCYRDILIDTSHFSDANTCIDASIVGTIYAIYWGDLPGFIKEGTDYSLNGTGFDINVANFDATAHAYYFHVYTIDTTGSCDNAVVITTGGGGTTYNFNDPLTEVAGQVNINNGGADGITKGAVTFTPSDFNSAAGLISLDYNNGQKATTSIPGFMTAAQATTLSTAVQSTRTITAGTGLTGGGDLSANRTITLQSINGFIAAGSNVTITGSGTIASPYSIASSGGGGSTDTTSLSNRIARLVLYHTLQTITYASSITMNTNSGYNGKVTLTGNATFAISNLTAGDEGWILVTQDATGGRTLTFPAGTKITNGYGSGVVPELSSGASMRDQINYIYDGTGIIITSVARNIQ